MKYDTSSWPTPSITREFSILCSPLNSQGGIKISEQLKSTRTPSTSTSEVGSMTDGTIRSWTSWNFSKSDGKQPSRHSHNAAWPALAPAIYKTLKGASVLRTSLLLDVAKLPSCSVTGTNVRWQEDWHGWLRAQAWSPAWVDPWHHWVSFPCDPRCLNRLWHVRILHWMEHRMAYKSSLWLTSSKLLIWPQAVPEHRSVIQSAFSHAGSWWLVVPC